MQAFSEPPVEKPRKLRRKPTQIRQDLGLCAETQKSSAAKIRYLAAPVKISTWVLDLFIVLWIRSVINRKSSGCILSSGNWVSTKLDLSGTVLIFKVSKH
ncbi:hypothetical protein DVH24_014954 [Malus domestica]|uniref:Uncharacterized protein n=1 Tax=Malus domestica TaxID=3750 RepID=A0A498K6T9_MALDO|nr:hypothetical protein DVH24_014954 [Malus domestica]